MATPRSKTKGKRILPNVPVDSLFKRGVSFKTETIETSIGGTQTPGKVKGEPLSPMNRLSNDEASRRSENSAFLDESGTNESGYSVEKEEASQLSKPLVIHSELQTNKCDRKVSVEVSIKREMVNGESDKENFPDSPRDVKSVTADRTPIKGANNFLLNNGIGIESLHMYSPSPNMKVRTPLRRHTIGEHLHGTPECYNVVHMDNPRYDFGFNEGRNDDGEDSCSVMVAVRVRPYSTRELSDPNVRNVVTMCGNETKVKADSGYEHRFMYDMSFSSFDVGDPEYVSQEHVYRALAQPLLGKAFEGYNTCLFAYGQTGSGKSYCIMGHGEDVGIIPRFCEELFSRTAVARDFDQVKIHVEISFFEIYNEKIHDLLASNNNKEKKTKKATLRVREHPTLGPYVEGLSTFVVNSFDDVKGWITLGNKNRATAATGMNDKSSRSHSVFTIVLTQTKTEFLEGQEHDHSITSKINLVDLAGSERQSQAQTSGERLREGANINKSLLTLGKVISQLAEQSKQSNKRKKIFIPYRDSVLTWLLKESLGGNSKTAMIATISPASPHIEETLSTLRYAQTARSIINIARVNEDPKAKLIRELRAEIELLRASGVSGNEDVTAACMVEISTLRDKLWEKEREMKEMAEMTKSWQERFRQSEERKLEEVKMLEKAGVTLKVDNQLPNFVNLNEDPQLSEMLLYNIKEGTTKVGRMGSHAKHDIQLNGALIADNHCVISNVETLVTVTPIADAPTYVNGNLISEPTTLHHGDRVILGGDHYFRFNHPIEVQQNKKAKNGPQTQEIKDFEFAQAELMRVQEARLQEARQAAQEEMLEEVEQAKREADLEKIMREETEGKVKQAEDVILKLKKQKMMLEQEVIAGRKRQQLEAEAALKASSQQSSERSRIMEMLQEQRDEAARKLEDLKQRRKDASRSQKSPTPSVLEVSTGKMDLYKIALQVREANTISQHLKKDTVFSREDYLDGEEERTVIKVTNTKLNVSTHWTLSKFEEKLIQMRDIYQTEDESTDEDDVFNDPADQWGKDGVTASPISPKRVDRRSVLSPSLRQALLSSVSSVNCSLYRQDSYTGKGENSLYKSCMPGVPSLCKDIVNYQLSAIKASTSEESIGDQILHCCYALRSCVQEASNLPVAMETNNNKTGRVDLLQLTCIQMTTGFNTLLRLSCLWSSMYQTLQSALIQDLLRRMRDQIKVMGGHIVRFMQGCEGDIDSLLEESAARLGDGVNSVCKLAGELALATDTHMLYFDDTATSTDNDNQVQSDVCQAFLNGCETFIDKTLQGALRTVDDLETRAQMLTDVGIDNMYIGDVPQNVEICVTSCKDLLLKCQQVQVEVDISNLEKSMSGQVHFYTGNYRKCEALISHVSALVEGVGLLVQHAEPVIQGRECDIRKVIKCAEMISKCSSNVANVCGQDGEKPQGSSNQNGGERSSETDTSHMTESQLDLLEYVSNDIQGAVDNLVESVQNVMELERLSTVATPRSKRLLPSHPNQTPVKKTVDTES